MALHCHAHADDNGSDLFVTFFAHGAEKTPCWSLQGFLLTGSGWAVFILKEFTVLWEKQTMSSKFQEMSLFYYELLAQTMSWCWFNTLLAYYNLKMLHFLNCSIITTTHLPHSKSYIKSFALLFKEKWKPKGHCLDT